jgi:hypothetical protein
MLHFTTPSGPSCAHRAVESLERRRLQSCTEDRQFQLVRSASMPRNAPIQPAAEKSTNTTTTADKIVFACVVALALLTAGGWVYSFSAERHAKYLMQTTYQQPTPEFRAAVAAAQRGDADERQMARGR